MSGQESSTILSPTTSASGGSGRAPCPLGDFELPQGFGAEVSLPSSLDLPMAEKHSIRNELARLGASDEERINYLQTRLNMLQDWIKSAFGVDDPHMEPPVQSPKVRSGSPRESTQRTTTVAGGDGISTPNINTSTVATAPAPPVLRIKLVDDKSVQKPSTTGISRATGTGSKNLSRMMSRPPAEGASAEAKAKLASQTPINVFWNYIEPFFKPIDENDLRSLEDGSRFIDPLPFTIPPLGRHYEERWREQYGYVSSRPASGAPRRAAAAAASILGADQQTQASPHLPLKVSSIRERLLAMMIEENLTVPETEGSSSSSGSSSANASNSDLTSAVIDEGIESTTLSKTGGSGGGGGGSPTPTPTTAFIDHIPVDERIKQELAQAGLCMFVPQVDYQEDDEICAEIRVLQRRLCETVCLNHYRKRRLASVVRERLAAQEFYLLLGDVDKQIEQAFAKRAKGLKKRQQSQHKRHGGTPSSGSTAAAAATLSPQAAAALPLVDTRDRLLAAFADLIPSQMIYLSGPLANDRDAGGIADNTNSLFSEQAETEVLQYARQTGNWLPIPEQPLQHVRLAKTAAHPVFPVLAVQAETDQGQQPRERHSSIQFEQPTIIQ